MRPLLLGLGLVIGINLARADSAADPSWSQIGGDAKRVTDAEQAQDTAALSQAVAQVRQDVAAFIKQYPSDKHAPGARMMLAQADQMALALSLPDAPTRADIAQEFHALAVDPAVPTPIRVKAAMVDAEQDFGEVVSNVQNSPDNPAVWNALDDKIEAYEKSAGDGPGQEPIQAAVVLRQNQILLLDHANQPTLLQELLDKLGKSPHPEMVELAKQAMAKLAQNAELKSKPLDLRFTAVDGRQVNLAKMRGKVVVVDFWATWCPPCVAGMPTLLAVYQKYHDRGLEIVGISLDQDKNAMQKFVADNHIPWPQYFDGQGPDNAIAKQYGIESIPVQWIIGKDGIIVTLAPDDLDAAIGKLLGGP